MKCPYCAAELQDNARFCLYCMRSLQEKRDVTPRHSRKKWLPWVIGGVCLAVLAAGILFWNLNKSKGAAAETVLIDPEGEYLTFVSAEDFCEEAVSRYGGSDVWQPFWLFYMDSRNGWDVFTTVHSVAGAELYISFYGGGSHVFASLTGVTEENIPRSMQMLNEITDSLYFNGQHSENGRISWRELSAGETVAGRTLLQLLGAEDAGSRPIRIKKQISDALYMLCELRKRSDQGDTFYDIYIFYGQ